MSTRDAYRYDPRRFLVLTERLALYSGVYYAGETITDDQAGSARDRLLEAGFLAETEYDLKRLANRPEVL